MSKFLSMAKVCERFGVHRATIYRWCKRGRFPQPIMLFGTPRWTEDGIDACLSNAPMPKPPPKQLGPRAKKSPVLTSGGPYSDLEEAIGEPLRSFTGADIIAMRQPLIYAWVRDGEVLYVGKGAVGMVRPLQCDHHRLKDILPTDELYIWHLQTADEVERIERQLIVLLKPRYNAPVRVTRQHVYEPIN